jgi:hypothetical protein
MRRLAHERLNLRRSYFGLNSTPTTLTYLILTLTSSARHGAHVPDQVPRNFAGVSAEIQGGAFDDVP